MQDEETNLRSDLTKLTDRRNRSKSSIATYEQYLKLLESTPVILGKIRDMEVMDALLRIFFSNFTVVPSENGFKQGSKVLYKLKEPWHGFILDKKFSLGALTG